MNFWENRSVLITGASGYLGGELLKELAVRGASVLGVDIRPPFKTVKHVIFERGELTNIKFVGHILKKHEIETCFHLAGLAGVTFCHQNPLAAFEANCRATWCFLEGCRSYGKLSEIIVTSSNHVYGPQKRIPTSEDAPLNAEGVYGTSKACADMIARCYAKSYGLPVAVARITNSFGGQDPHLDHLIGGTITAVLRGQRPVIRGNGSATKGYLYVRDTIKALIMFAEWLRERNLAGEAINFVPSSPASVLDTVREILRLMDRGDMVPDVLGDSAVEEEFEHLLNLKARDVLGWRPEFTFEDGLRQAIEDYELQLERGE